MPRQIMLDVLRLLAPFAPHLAEELWARLGNASSIMAAGWPAFDPAKLVTNTVKIVIQVNGKHRGEVVASVAATEAELVALACAQPKVAAHINSLPIKKTIYVKGRLINILV